MILPLLLLGVLVALNGLYRTVQNWQPTLSASDGSVLYAAAFDGFMDEWQQYNGRLSANIQDGALVLKADELASNPFSLATPILSDFDLSVTATVTAGPLDNGFGVIFRLQDGVVGCDMPLQILCDLAEIDAFGVVLRLLFRPISDRATGYYYFMVSSDGYYALFKATQVGNSTQAERVSTWIPSEAIQQGIGAQNTVRVLAQGDTFQFFINGQAVNVCIPDDPTAQSTRNPYTGECVGGKLLDTYVDNTFTSGKIGMIIRSPETITGNFEAVTVAFDNLIIISPRKREVQA
jgi:hypothetical protein